MEPVEPERPIRLHDGHGETRHTVAEALRMARELVRQLRERGVWETEMKILAIDPGPTESAFVVWDGEKARTFDKIENYEMLQLCKAHRDDLVGDRAYVCVIEKIASYGMAVGAEVFETCVWTGRFMEAFNPDRTDRITRGEVKNHLCRSSKAKDGNIRQALIDRFGGPSAIGKKKTPGPLYGVSGDVWSALAVAVTWFDKNASESKP